MKQRVNDVATEALESNLVRQSADNCFVKTIGLGYIQIQNGKGGWQRTDSQYKIAFSGLKY